MNSLEPQYNNFCSQIPKHPKSDQVRFDYSTKSIPIPPRNSHLIESYLEKVESVIKRMSWKAFFFDRNKQDNNDATNNDNFGFKSRKCPSQSSELDKFEADLLDMVHNIKFRNVNNKFQKKTQRRHQQNQEIDKSLHSCRQNFRLLQAWQDAARQTPEGQHHNHLHES